jgi:hypothetical protein
MRSTRQDEIMSSIPLSPLATNLPSTDSFVNSSSIPPRPARPDLEISFNEFVEGPSDFSQDAPYGSGHPSVETRRARSRTVTAVPRRYPRPPPTATAPTQPLPSIPTSPEQDLDGSEDGVYRRLVGVFSPRVTQGLDTAGVKARQARKESDIAVGSTAPSSRSPEALRQPSSPPLSPLVPLTPILERIWPLFFNRWKPAITSPLTKPAAVPVAHDSSNQDSPQSYYTWSTPAIESLESPYVDPAIPFSPDSFINSSPPLKTFHTPLVLQTPTVRFTADASPRTTTATGNPSRPVSTPDDLKQQSPMSFASRATVSSSRTLRHTSDGPMRFSPGMGMKALEFGRIGKIIYVGRFLVLSESTLKLMNIGCIRDCILSTSCPLFVLHQTRGEH